jgi:hypothetical protein
MDPRRLLLLALTFGAVALSNGSAASSDEAVWNAVLSGQPVALISFVAFDDDRPL